MYSQMGQMYHSKNKVRGRVVGLWVFRSDGHPYTSGPPNPFSSRLTLPPPLPSSSHISYRSLTVLPLQSSIRCRHFFVIYPFLRPTSYCRPLVSSICWPQRLEGIFSRMHFKRVSRRPIVASILSKSHPTENLNSLSLRSSQMTQITEITPPLPTLSLSLTSKEALNEFLKSHLSSPLSPQSLLSFFQKKLHHHPRFTHFDFHVFRWATSIDGFRHDHSTYSWMARTLASTHRLDDLHSFLPFILSHPCPCSDDSIFCCPGIESTFRIAIHSFCRAGRLNDAVFAFDNMKHAIDGKPDRVTYNILISGFVRARSHDKAIEFYGKMIEDGVRPDVCTFNTLIDSYCRNSGVESALGLFKEMRVKGCTPNVITFNTLIRGCFRTHLIEKGIGIAYEMVELDCGFSAATCEILVDGLCRVGQAVRACELLVDLLRKVSIPDDFNCLQLVEALCGGGEVERALKLVNELHVKGKGLDTVVCTTLIECLTNSGNIGGAVYLMERMLKDGVVPDSVTFNCLLLALCDVGRTMDANRLRLLAFSKGLEADGVTYDTLVSGFSREGRRREGESVLDEMLDAGFVPDITTYNRFMDQLQNGSKLASHLKLL